MRKRKESARGVRFLAVESGMLWRWCQHFRRKQIRCDQTGYARYEEDVSCGLKKACEKG